MAWSASGSVSSGLALAIIVVGCGQPGSHEEEPRWHDVALGADVTARFAVDCDGNLLSGCVDSPVSSKIYARTGGRVATGQLEPFDPAPFEVLSVEYGTYELRAPSEPNTYVWNLLGGETYQVVVYDPAEARPKLVLTTEDDPISIVASPVTSAGLDSCVHGLTGLTWGGASVVRTWQVR